MSIAAPAEANEQSPEVEPARRPRLGLSTPGPLVAALFFALSLTPSLLPREPYVQGVAAGITAMIGYGLGTGGAALWRFLEIPALRGRARTIVVWVLVGLIALVAAAAIWQFVGWQNEIRERIGMDPVSPIGWPIIAVVALLVAALILLVGRGLRRLTRVTEVQSGSHRPEPSCCLAREPRRFRSPAGSAGSGCRSTTAS